MPTTTRRLLRVRYRDVPYAQSFCPHIEPLYDTVSSQQAWAQARGVEIVIDLDGLVRGECQGCDAFKVVSPMSDFVFRCELELGD
jgi:hypothetical protein